MADRVGWWVMVMVLGLALGLGLGARPSGALGPAQSTPTTVVVEPTPKPAPLLLPRLLKRYDPQAPGPIESRFEGYVAKLTRPGREACSPATHILQSRPDGFPGAQVWAVLYSPRPGASYNLDFYVGEYVEAFGFSGLAPDTCASLTWQLLSVEAIRRIVLPPGAAR